MNCTPVTYDNYRIGVDGDYMYEEIINSDKDIYNGSNRVNPIPITVQDVPWQHKERSILMTIPPLGISVLRPIEKPKTEVKTKKTTIKTTSKKTTKKKQ